MDCDRLTTITYVDCRVTSLPDITHITDPCGGFSEYIPGPELDLDVLEKQLHDQIQQIEQLQVRQAEAAKPSSVEEIDALKAGLADAMKELDDASGRVGQGRESLTMTADQVIGIQVDRSGGRPSAGRPGAGTAGSPGWPGGASRLPPRWARPTRNGWLDGCTAGTGSR